MGSTPARNLPTEDPCSDPHLVGFGPIPLVAPKLRTPPPSREHAGVLGSQPQKVTRVDDPPETKSNSFIEGEKLPDETFPPLKQSGSSRSIPLSSPPPPPQSTNPRFKNLTRFLGYFHKPKSTAHRSYSQVVRAEAAVRKMAPPVQNRGGGRDGFGAGRHGRGAGRTGARNVWQRMESSRPRGEDRGHGGDRDARANQPGEPKPQPEDGGQSKDEPHGDSHTQATSNWERVSNPSLERTQQEQDQEATKTAPHNKEKTGPDAWPESSRNAEKRGTGWADNRNESRELPGCKFCGLHNHLSEDCRRKPQCELCGYNNHNTFECRREPLWNFGPELCAAQVEDQSFFYIDEVIDARVSMEKSSTAIITVIKGEANARQIEAEFKHIDNNKVWRWSARKLAENKFSLRFPDAQMVQVYSNFKSLGMKEAEAQIVVEPWNAAAQAKGELQQAWFRVKGIPTDQRSAKVGGLVGKTMAIDEKTIFKSEYVRIKIACRDVMQVPASAESSLGLKLFDFFFEREVSEEAQQNATKLGVKIDSNQPQSKKPRIEEPHLPRNNASGKEKSPYTHNKNNTQFGNITNQLSAPAKISWEKKENLEANSGKTKDLEKKMDTGNQSWEDSEESDNFSLGINGGDCPPLLTKETYEESELKLIQCSDTQMREVNRALFTQKASLGTIANLFESNMADEDKAGKNSTPGNMLSGKNTETVDNHAEQEAKRVNEADIVQNIKGKNIFKQDRRTSARLQKDILLTTDDKLLAMGRKRNLEGTHTISENSFSILEDSEITQIVSGMGVNIDDSNFIAIDLVKEMEVARHSINDKMNMPTAKPIAEDIIIEEIEEELSDFDCPIAPTPKRKSKPKKKTFSLRIKRKKRVRKILAPKKPKRILKETLSPPWLKKQKKANINERPLLEL